MYIYIYIYISIKNISIYAILCRNVTIFYRQELVFLFQVQELKVKLFVWLLTDDSHIKIFFTKHGFLHFWHNVRLLKSHPVKVPQNYFFQLLANKNLQLTKIISIAQMKQACKFEKLNKKVSSVLGKWKKNWFKSFINSRNKNVMGFSVTSKYSNY